MNLLRCTAPILLTIMPISHFLPNILSTTPHVRFCNSIFNSIQPSQGDTAPFYRRQPPTPRLRGATCDHPAHTSAMRDAHPKQLFHYLEFHALGAVTPPIHTHTHTRLQRAVLFLNLRCETLNFSCTILHTFCRSPWSLYKSITFCLSFGSLRIFCCRSSGSLVKRLACE